MPLSSPKLLLAAVLSAAVPNVLAASAPHAYGFTANTFLIYDGEPLYNHAIFLAYPEARGHKIQLNPAADDPHTYCPPTVREKKQCPKPNPSDIKTQFNSTLTTGGPAGTVYMNSAGYPGVGKQSLYVAKNGLLQFTAPGAAVPTGSYASLFNLGTNFQGSQTMISNPVLEFNGSYSFYSCLPPPMTTPLNLTYAKVAGGKDVTDCVAFTFISDVYQLDGGFPQCPYSNYNGTNPPPPEHCDRAAYEYK